VFQKEWGVGEHEIGVVAEHVGNRWRRAAIMDGENFDANLPPAGKVT